MIARLWKGWTSRDDADAYEQVFRSEVVPELQGVRGHQGAYLLRRALPDGVEFAALTLFDSLEAVRAFAGDDYEVAVISPAARRVLTRFDQTSQHFEVAMHQATKRCRRTVDDLDRPPDHHDGNPATRRERNAV